MVINHQGGQAQRLHSLLEQRLSQSVTLYKQDEQQPDVWQTLNGDKDDFLIYDRRVTWSWRSLKSLHFQWKPQLISILAIMRPHRAFNSSTHQVWPPHLPHLTSILRHWTWPYRGCNQRHLLQAWMWELHIWGIARFTSHASEKFPQRQTYALKFCLQLSSYSSVSPFFPVFLQSSEIPDECKRKVEPEPETPTGNVHTGHGDSHGHHHGHGHRHHGNHHGHHGQHHGVGQEHSQSQHSDRQLRFEQDHGASQSGGQQHLNLDQMQQAMHMVQMPQEVQGHTEVRVMHRHWEPSRAHWKLKHSWQWTAGSEASPPISWCWYWRKLYFGAGSEQPVGLWHCDEALPASWQWHRLMAEQTREAWQWRPHPADWQQPQPAQWVWPPGVVSWAWEL